MNIVLSIGLPDSLCALQEGQSHCSGKTNQWTIYHYIILGGKSDGENTWKRMLSCNLENTKT